MSEHNNNVSQENKINKYCRNKEERQLEVKPIISKLAELHLSPTSSEAIKTLYQKLQTYINEGEKIELNIPFPEYNANIVGVLHTKLNKRVWVKIEHIKE